MKSIHKGTSIPSIAFVLYDSLENAVSQTPENCTANFLADVDRKG